MIDGGARATRLLSEGMCIVVVEGGRDASAAGYDTKTSWLEAVATG